MNRLIVMLTVALVLLVPIQAHARAGHGGAEPAPITATVPAVPLAQGERGISLDEAVARVRSRFGGKIIRAETHYRNGRAVHRIKVLTDDGRVRSVSVDARSGRMN